MQARVGVLANMSAYMEIIPVPLHFIHLGYFLYLLVIYEKSVPPAACGNRAQKNPQILSWWQLCNFKEMSRVNEADSKRNKLTINFKIISSNKNNESFFLSL